MFAIRHSIVLATIVTASFAVRVLAQDSAQHILVMSPEKLVEVLKNPQSPMFDKAKACQRLALIGTKEAIPALAALLPDETLNLYARCGLEGIQDPSADEALRTAASALHGRQLVGVLDSIGHKRDVHAIELLKDLLRNSDTAVASAAARALGNIGTVQTAEILTDALANNSLDKSVVAESCLDCAEHLAVEGENQHALSIYQSVGKSGVSKPLRLAALAGQFRIQQAEALNLLLTQLRSSDEDVFNLGLAFARRMVGDKVSEVLAAELDNLQSPRKALLLLALSDRNEEVPLSAVQRASSSSSEVVRAAAMEVLAKRGDVSAAGILLDAALGEDHVALMARQHLKTLKGVAIDDVIASRFNDADSMAKPVLLELVGARQLTAAKPVIVSLLSDPDETVRIAALTALGQLAELNDLELLLSRALVENASSETEAAQVALGIAAQGMTDREACAARLVPSLVDAPSSRKLHLLRVLGKVSGKTALDSVTASAKSNDPKLKDAATEVLGEWANSDAAPALLDIAKYDPNPMYRIRALRGYVRIARQLQLPDDLRLEFFHTAMQTAQRDEEKQVAMDILTRIPSVTTLELAISHLQEPSLKDAAVEAAVKISGILVSSDPSAVSVAMQKVVELDVANDRAKQLLVQARAASK